MKLYRLFYIIALLVLFSCTSTRNLYESKRYDDVIEILTKKSKTATLNNDELTMLKMSYHEANEGDHDKIMELKKSGEPDIWGEVYNLYNRMDRRQNLMSRQSADIKKAINHKTLNLDEEIAAAKNKTELYICAKVNALLEDPDKNNIASADSLVNQLIKINPHNSNIDALKIRTVLSSANSIVFRVAALNNIEMPKDYAKTVLDFHGNLIGNNPYDVTLSNDKSYDLMIRVLIEESVISPERIDAVTFKESKDSLTATVTDKTITKTATVKGKIEYIDLSEDMTIISTPFNITSTFKYNFAEISGDKSACSEQTLRLLNNDSIRFPTDEALLKDTGRKLNKTLQNILFEQL
ncbi:MAG TPA: hypothetical protein IAD13_06950 [Bacteroidetes bacterium]|nr:hypothetical protein [Candidatus Limimorpha avicola]